jgi:peptide-methionine (S)-S-oxide reductase
LKAGSSSKINEIAIMKKSILFFSLLVFVFSCGRSQEPQYKIHPGQDKPYKNEALATFGEGCFWHAEIIFQSLEGVRDAVSGYAGGKDVSPTYEEVSSGSTGHAETVQVYYDPARVSFRTLVAAFFASHDPTTKNRQGNDIGTEYRSVVFYRNAAEKKVIEEEWAEAQKRYKRPIVTEVLPFSVFYPAEEYHQEYILHHPGNRYVQVVSIPEYNAFRSDFKGKFKP